MSGVAPSRNRATTPTRLMKLLKRRVASSSTVQTAVDDAGSLESSRQYADDGHRMAIQFDAPAQHALVAAEVDLPEVVT